MSKLPIKYNGDNFERIQELKEFCDIGDSFNYMGYKMLVLKHYTVDYGYQLNREFPFQKDYTTEIRFPLLQTEYINPVTGQFEKKDFTYSQLGILRKQN